MRHRNAGRKLGRNSTHRKAMFRNMVTSLFKYDRIRTTDAKAKELRGWADHIVTLAKRGDLHARRQALSIVRERDVVHKVFEEAKERYGAIHGGYTRIVKLGRRPGDAAPVCLVELVSENTAAPRKPRKKPRPQAKTAPETPVVDTAEAASEAEAEKASRPAPGTDAEAEAAPAEDAAEDAQAEDDEPQAADAAEASSPEEVEPAADSEADVAGDEAEEASKKEQ